MAAPQNRTPQQILDEVKSHDGDKVKVAITDIDGVLRGKYLHKEKFLKAVEGNLGFCNVVFGWDIHDVCYDNVTYTGWHTGYPDAAVKLDLSTYRRVPWDGEVPFFLGEFIDEKGGPLAICPRQLAKTVLAKAKSAGYEAKVGLEFEWFNFRETPETLHSKGHQNPQPITPGMFGYSLLRSGSNREYFNAIMDELLSFDVPIEGLHTETGPGVYEAAIMATTGIEAADRAVLFKSGVKEIAYGFGIVPSFMARWNTSLPGCSGHMHQSLKDLKSGKNAFFDSNDPNKMSDLFKSYLAGQMHCLPEILPMFAPNVNSYKRLVEGFWAPTRVLWGLDNRTTAFRVIPGSEGSTRLETRVGGSDINPYLTMAAGIASGIYGIENKMKLTMDPFTGNAYASKSGVSLPGSLIEATEKFYHSEVAATLFGKSFVEHYAKSREWEWKQFKKAVTDWEMKRYFELV